MNFENLDVRQAIADKHVFYYEVADRLGITNTTFSVWMRSKMSPERKAQILKVIDSFDK